MALLFSSVLNFRVDARLVNAVGFLLVFIGAKIFGRAAGPAPDMNVPLEPSITIGTAGQRARESGSYTFGRMIILCCVTCWC